MPDGQLPPALGASVAATKESYEARILQLKGDLQNTEDALAAERGKNSDLQKELDRLKDNINLRRTALRFSRVFLVLVPLVCLALLLILPISQINVSVWGWQASGSWEDVIPPYTFTALVVSPILFITTILGFLLKGVFGNGVSDSIKEAGVEVLKATNGIGPKVL